MEINYEQPKIEARFIDTSKNCIVNNSSDCHASSMLCSLLFLLIIIAIVSCNENGILANDNNLE